MLAKEFIISELLEKIEKDIQHLSSQERAFLADRLLGTLPNDDISDIDEAWIKEAESRYLAYKNGKRAGIEAKDVFQKADKILK